MEQIINYPGWEIVREIGTGSYGKVYEIKKENSFVETENSALKVISIPPQNLDVQSYSEELGLDEEGFSAMVRHQMESITKEFSLMSQLKGNSNIVSYEDHSVVEHEGEPGWDIYIRMELLVPLTEYLRNNNIENSVDESFVVKLGTDICKALTVCENHHIVHRDIKPQNIFINKDGNFKLGDFGIAKNAENVAIGTRTGTFNYMAPEIYNNKPYGKSVDVYSLGLVMYWLLNERRAPFLPMFPAVPTKSDVDSALLRRISGDEIPEPKNGSATIKRIVLKAIQCDPQKRYLSATEMLKDLTDSYENGVARQVTSQEVKKEPVKEQKQKSKTKKSEATPKKKKLKKAIIFSIIAILLILAFPIILVIVDDISYNEELTEIVPNITMLMGHHEADDHYSEYTNITVDDQIVEVNVFPKSIEMSEAYENVLFLTYTDRYEYNYIVYGTVSSIGNNLTISPCEDLGIDSAYSVTETINYHFEISYDGKVTIDIGEYSVRYSNANEITDGFLAISGSADGEMFSEIKSINILYSMSDLVVEEEHISDISSCQIVFADGSYTLDAIVDYYSEGYVAISWSNRMIIYNGRNEIENDYGYISLDLIDNYPYGFTIMDTETGKTYSYQNEAIDYIEE